MTLISKELYEKRIFIPVDYESDTVIEITNKVNDLIDEIANYKPLYAARKKIQEQGPEYAIEHMKKVVAVTIKLKLGDDNGDHTKL